MLRDSEIQRYGVIIIESLPNGDCKTGTNLYNGLLKYKSHIKSEFFAELHIVQTRTDFFSEFQQLACDIDNNTMISIHIEAHGGESGLKLASSEIITWKELHDILRPINIKLLGLLHLAIATCYSFPFTWSIDISQRASFKTVVFTKREMTADEIERGFIEYYQDFFNILDSFNSLNAIQKEVNDGDPHKSPFQIMVADWAFDQISNPENNPDFHKVISSLYVKLKLSNPSITKAEVERDCKNILALIRENGRDYFLLKDLR